MRKPFTKIICVIVAVIVAAGIWLFAGCGNLYDGDKLSGSIDGAVTSNGGFAVEKGNYLYFVNGSESYTADNSYGTPVKGAIMRISKENLKNRKYSSVETVVPLVVYSGNTDAGIFVYGDYVYYSTPSTEKNSDGEVLNTKLDFKRSKLDGTETMKDYYLQLETNSADYRYVEVGNTVYLVYVATSEKLYDEATGVTNLHSLNTATGENTVLAYNVSSVQFDDGDKTNPQIYYTMAVTDYASGSAYSYNQVYTVRADATEKNVYDFDKILGWDKEEDRYENCGDLVFDGIGYMEGTDEDYDSFEFNYDKTGATRNQSSYTYTLSAYTNGALFYTRTSTNNSNAYLFMLTESSALDGGKVKESWNAVDENPERGMRLLTNGSSAASYTYLFDNSGAFQGVLNAETDGGISVNYAYTENGSVKLGNEIGSNDSADYFYLLNEGTATILFVDGSYLYYSLSGGNGYSVYRIDYTGRWNDYNGMPVDDDIDEYNPVRILDIDAASDWYLPELVDGQLLFAADTDDMSSYNYIMACDLRKDENGTAVMSNVEINAMNEKFEKIEELIADYGDTDNYPANLYANLENALRFAYFTGDADYIKGLAEKCNAAALEKDEDADPVYSERTLAQYAAFLAPAAENDWSDYTDSRQINGQKVYANRRDYYYSLLGKMSGSDAESYFDSMKSDYLQSEPVDDTTWWEGLSTANKVWFVIGVTVGGLIVVGGIAVLVILLIKRDRRKHPEQRRRRIKVDTTDDKNIDVYATDDEVSENKENADND